MIPTTLVVLALSAFAAAFNGPLVGGPQGVNLWRANKAAAAETPNLAAAKRAEDFPVFNFTQPLDHFNESYEGFTFNQRYWVSTRNYDGSDDAPVIVLDGGETSGAGRLPFLDYGIVDILTKATGGVGVILEHRYYGESIPVQNFSTDSLRWLNNEQALADSDNFLRNVNFSAAGIDKDLTAPGTKWIYYGGSYAGARAAHVRVLFPDVVYGAISSSGVTEAIIDYWQYIDTIRNALNQTCSDNVVGSTDTIDEYLSGGNDTTRQIKTLFGLQDLSDSADFGSTLGWYSWGGWQGQNWDPAIGDTSVPVFCSAVNTAPDNNTDIESLPYGDDARKVNVTLSANETITVDYALANYAKFINDTVVSPYVGEIEERFGTQNDTYYQQDDLSQDWRLWTFQVCTQWGYYQGAPPAEIPSIISRRVDLAYNSKICKQAFLPGEFFTVPAEPNVTAVNSLGGFDIAYDRLAIIDGEVDPWRAATPHSTYNATDREDTIVRPFKLIEHEAVHHWDENGLPDFSAEPDYIQDIQNAEIEFVQAWLSEDY